MLPYKRLYVPVTGAKVGRTKSVMVTQSGKMKSENGKTGRGTIAASMNVSNRTPGFLLSAGKIV